MKYGVQVLNRKGPQDTAVHWLIRDDPDTPLSYPTCEEAAAVAARFEGSHGGHYTYMARELPSTPDPTVTP